MTDYIKQHWWEDQAIINRFNLLRNKYHAYCKLMGITPKVPKYPFEDMTHAILMYQDLINIHGL